MAENGSGNALYILLVIHLLVILGFAAFILLLSHHLGRRTTNRDKETPYECGMRPVGSPHRRFGLRYYLVAILFILFDIEVIFLFPWAVNLRELGPAGFLEMLIFMGILVLGLAYAWRKGALEWE